MIWLDKPNIFFYSFQQRFSSESQNVLKTNLLKSQICPILVPILANLTDFSPNSEIPGLHPVYYLGLAPEVTVDHDMIQIYNYLLHSFVI